MRNYLGELKAQGLTYKQIAAETGISRKRVSEIARGIETVKSATDTYATIRNVSRRLGYQKLRETLSAKEAEQYRRIVLSERTYTHKTIREVKHTHIEKDMIQLKILAEFRNTRTKKLKEEKGFSSGYERSQFNQSEATGEAIREAQSRLGGSNWELQRIIDLEYITYQIG